MAVREVVPGVQWVGSIDWDRKVFDELIPLPHGTSYNAYLVKGTEKTALIDTVDPKKEFELVANLISSSVDRIDYLIVNHAEQDHSGSLPMLLELFPMAKVVTNEKCCEFLKKFHEIEESCCHIIKDGDTLDLGGATLEFIITPWVHWPETMVTYLREKKILFSCDLFGSHLATSDLFVIDENTTYTAAKRYYAEIMMPFRNSIKGHLERLDNYEINIIAPSHGPLYDRPGLIIDAYRDWTGDHVKNEAIILYVSMHGSTEKMVAHLTDALIKREIPVKVLNLGVCDTGEISVSLVDAATIILATPTVLFGPHPLMVYAAYLANLIRPKAKFGTVIGSYAWGGKTIDTLKGMLNHLTLEFLTPIYIQGTPDITAFQALDKLADAVEQKHKNLV